MKTIIYYFSGTGNSLQAARKLRDCIVHSELHPIAQCIAQGRYSDDADRAVFVFPLYYLGFPKIVMDFLERYRPKAGADVICVVTRGFPPMGGAVRQFARVMKKKGVAVSRGFYLDMPSNDVILFGLQDEETRRAILSTVDSQINGILQAISANRFSLAKEPFGFMRPLRHGPAYLGKLRDARRRFRVAESCTGCGVCSEVCAMGNVTVASGKPVWGDRCQLCEACLNFCPRRAIDFGKRSARQERYTNPGCGYRDIANQK